MWYPKFVVTEQFGEALKASSLTAYRVEVAGEENLLSMDEGPFATKFGANLEKAVACLVGS